MPVYGGSLTLPAGGGENDQTVETIKFFPGILETFNLYFPPGHAGLTYVRVMYQNNQFLPIQVGEYFRGDTLLIPLTPKLLMDRKPFQLKVSGYNLDATFDHDIIYWFEVEPLNRDFTLKDLKRIQDRINNPE